ncbi:MAG: restriction endonuclease [Chloroflexi bacterium]|nr:restriction endonuclease [Chloroflexota bacterium]
MDLFLDVMTFLSQPLMDYLLLLPIGIQVALILAARRRAETAEWDPLLQPQREPLWRPSGPLREALAAPALEVTLLWIFVVGVPLYTWMVWNPMAPVAMSMAAIGLTLLAVAGWVAQAYLWVKEAASPASTQGVYQFRRELERLTPEAFKVFAAVLFRMRGYQATVVQRSETGGDILLENPKGERELVLCSARNDRPLGEFVVRDLHAAIVADDKAVRGYVFAVAGFTREARSWAHARDIRLIDGPQLMRAVAATNRPEPTAPVPALVTVRS